MFWTFITASAFEPIVTGGAGMGGVASFTSISRPGVVLTGSAEVHELIEPIPWLGVALEAEVGFVPIYCTTCSIAGIARFGTGLSFRNRSGFLVAGMRYSVLNTRTAFRPFLLTKVSLDIGGMVFRPYVWAEGFTAPEIGLGLEIGVRLVKGRPVVFQLPNK